MNEQHPYTWQDVFTQFDKYTIAVISVFLILFALSMILAYFLCYRATEAPAHIVSFTLVPIIVLGASFWLFVHLMSNYNITRYHINIDGDISKIETIKHGDTDYSKVHVNTYNGEIIYQMDKQLMYDKEIYKNSSVHIVTSGLKLKNEPIDLKPNEIRPINK